MSRILDAVSVLNPEPDADAIDQLFAVAKKFTPLPVPDAMDPPQEFHMESEVSRLIPLDQCDTDPSYQRPLDREKVAAMKLDKAWEKQPIHVNFSDGTYWIIDGQHRAEAARQSGVKEVHAYADFMPSQDEAEHETGVMAKTAGFKPHPLHSTDWHGKPDGPKNPQQLREHLTNLSAKHGGAWVADETYGAGKQYHYPNRSSVPDHFMEESHHRDGLAVNGKWTSWTPAQKIKNQNKGFSADKTFNPDALRSADSVYEGHVLPSHEPDLLDALTGMGAELEVSKVATYGWRGRCYVVRCSTGTITYVPNDAVEKDAGEILTQPERGLLRFDGLTETEVQYVLKTIGLDVAPVNLEGTPDLTGMESMAGVLGITSDNVEVLCEGIGGRTWRADWVYLGDSGIVVTDGETTLATYPVVSRHPTVEGDWRFIGPKHDLTVRPA